MTWYLQQQTGRRFDDVAVLNEGQSVVVGRSTEADVTCPRDTAMSSRHLRVMIQDGTCQINDLNSANGSFINEEKIDTGQLNPGDQLRCGQTHFQLESTEGTPASPITATENPASTSATTAAPVATVTAVAVATAELPEELQKSDGFVAKTATAIVEEFELSPLIETAPDKGETPEQFATRLLQADDPSPVLKFLAAALPKRLGVWWAVQCVQRDETLTDGPDGELLKLVTEWVLHPDDRMRRAAFEQAQELGMQSAACWCAVSAFWATGSMAPLGQPEVPAGTEMAGRAISGATQLASIVDPPQAPARCQEFAQLALQMATGEHSWTTTV